MFSFFKKKSKDASSEDQFEPMPAAPVSVPAAPALVVPLPHVPDVADAPVAAPARVLPSRFSANPVQARAPAATPAVPIVPAVSATSAIIAPRILTPEAPAVQPMPVAPPPAAPPPAQPAAPLVHPAPQPAMTGEIDVGDGVIVREAVPEEQKRNWLTRLKVGLSKTSSNLTTLFVGAKIGDELYEELESALLMSDAGVSATQYLLDTLKKKVRDEKLMTAEQVKAALRTIFVDLLTPLQKPLVLGRHQPLVMMVTGVNGAGKTTTIGKLAKHLQAHRQSVLLAAGDTFRAAAREQLTIWGERNNVAVISQTSGDPAAVAFDAVHSGLARGIDVVMIDTAGRLPTQLHLMEELKKIKRVVTKGMASAPHEILLIIDGNTGQNALAQVKAFDDALGLTGLVVTKLDGTAKGGVLAAIAKSRPIPVYFIGVGEQIEDLQPFDAQEFVDALLGWAGEKR